MFFLKVDTSYEAKFYLKAEGESFLSRYVPSHQIMKNIQNYDLTLIFHVERVIFLIS